MPATPVISWPPSPRSSQPSAAARSQRVISLVWWRGLFEFVAALGGTEIICLPAHLLLNGRCGRDESAAHGVFLKLAAGWLGGRTRRRARRGMKQFRESPENDPDYRPQLADEQHSRDQVQDRADHCFFLGTCFFAPGFENSVSTAEPICPSIALAASANCPLGCSSRYFWNSSSVPGGAVILPSAAVVAFPNKQMPYWK